MPDDEFLAAVAQLRPAWTVRSSIPLSSGGRAEVRRLQVTVPSGDELTVVAKRFRQTEEEAAAREGAALSLASELDLPLPGLLAESDPPGLLLMTDLGEGRNLADDLLAPDASAAEGSLRLWAAAVASLHAATLGQGAAFAHALRRRTPGRELPVDTMPQILRSTVQVLVERAQPLPSADDPGLRQELARIEELLCRDSGHHALSPADTCPDNNVRRQDRLQLLDFEGATVRHVAWDAAYLTVPFPTCWCAWRLPEAVSERCLELYRKSLAAAHPWVASPEFDEALAAARLAWCVIASGWLLPLVLDQPVPAVNPSRPAPTRSALAAQRLRDGEHLAGRQGFPRIAALFQLLASRLPQLQGEQELPVAAAFRPPCAVVE